MKCQVFLSTLSLRRATSRRALGFVDPDISIHALLAESDSSRFGRLQVVHYFYPRSPCGERLLKRYPAILGRGISIHALLAESDRRPGQTAKANKDFYPRSPCGERHDTYAKVLRVNISIHALLAESDLTLAMGHLTERLFLSTLSLRRATLYVVTVPSNNTFLSTLSLRRATFASWTAPSRLLFLSTLSLRRATLFALLCNFLHHDFYPRSPCGERRRRGESCYLDNIISIHALLAESDRSAGFGFCRPRYFYPRSPCGERLYGCYSFRHSAQFLSTLSLRRATLSIAFKSIFCLFLSTLSLRRATRELV